MRRFPRGRAQVEEPRFLRAAEAPQARRPPTPTPSLRIPPLFGHLAPGVLQRAAPHLACHEKCRITPALRGAPGGGDLASGLGGTEWTRACASSHLQLGPHPARALTCLRLSGRGQISLRAAPGSQPRPGVLMRLAAARWESRGEPERVEDPPASPARRSPPASDALGFVDYGAGVVLGVSCQGGGRP